jgi:RNA polymerase sigma-70 factor (ECF subfamily)
VDQIPKQRIDDELLDDARNGSTHAFAELVRRYQGKVAATVIGMLGNCEEANDVAQETFIRFYDALKKFRGDSSIGTYLTRIAINLSLNELRRRKRRGFLFKTIDHDFDVPDLSSTSSADHYENKELLDKAMIRLDGKFRAVITLRLIEGYSTEETAAILQLPLGTVLSRLKRAQKKLHSILTSYKEGS